MPKETFLRLDSERQERVLRAAIAEFQAHGYHKAKVETIARNAGVAKGSLYQYFEDKNDLFLYAVTWAVNVLVARVDQQTPFEQMDVFDYFHVDSRRRLEIVREEPILAEFTRSFYAGHFGQQTAEVRAQMEKAGDAYIRRLIANGQRKGTVRADLDADVLLDFFRTVTVHVSTAIVAEFGFLASDVTEGDVRRVEKRLADMVTLLREGMGK